jgi:hypothetical protein
MGKRIHVVLYEAEEKKVPTLELFDDSELRYLGLIEIFSVKHSASGPIHNADCRNIDFRLDGPSPFCFCFRKR